METKLQNNQTSDFFQQQQRKKKVRFVVSRFSYIEPNDEDSEGRNHSELYYSQEDYADMHIESRAILNLMQTCLPIKLEHGLCSRGLEDRTPHGARRRIWNHARAFSAVHREQKRQKDDGVCDPEKLADAYRCYSTSCQTEACNMAKQDAIDARRIQRESTQQSSCEKRSRRDDLSMDLEEPRSPKSPRQTCSRMIGQRLLQQRKNSMIAIHL